MIQAIENILKVFSEEISSNSWAIEGFDLSYVDNRENHIEIFSYSSDSYFKAVSTGFTKHELGSLLQSEKTFQNGHTESIYEIISETVCSEIENCNFRSYSGFFSGKSNKAEHSKWIEHYKSLGLSGVYFSAGKRRKGDFDLVLFGVIKGDNPKDIREKLPKIVRSFTKNLNDFAIVFENLRKNRKSVIEQATRAAISQVMARNTSHNIGAHVMNKLIGDLSKVKIDGFTNYKSDIKLYDASENANEQLLDQISIFNNYVKCRMDYLADISFGTPLMQTNKYAYADLFKELDKVRLLLEHISGLDKFEFEIKFQKNGEDLNDTNDLLVAIPNDILGTQAFYNILENIIRNSAKHSDKSKLEKESVVFTVNFIDDVKSVKNYCRCSEVGCTKAHKKEIENALNEFIAVEVYDNIPVEKPEEKFDLEESDVKEFNDKKTSLPKDNKFSAYIDKLVFSQNKKLNEDILQENKLRSYSLGLVEMDASAAYLRKHPVEYINHPSYDIQYDESWSRNTEKNNEVGRDQVTHRGTNCRHFMKAFKKTDGNKNYLGYRFFLHRPAVVLVLSELLEDKENDSAEGKKQNKDKKDKLRKEGVWLITPTAFEDELKAGKVYPHEFIVYAAEGKNIIEPLINQYKTSLPIRMLCIDHSPLDELIKNSLIQGQKPVDVWERFCWGEWIKRMGLENGVINTSVDCNQSLDGVFRGVLIDHKKEDWLDYENCERANFVEVLTSKALEKLPKLPPFESGIKDPIKKYVAHLDEYESQYKKVLESSFSTIVVIDERIQKFAEKEFIAGKSYFDYLSSMRIILPRTPKSHEQSFYETNNISENMFNLSASNMDKKFAKSLLDYISYYSTTLKKSDFILIHYSLLERIFNNETDKTIAINNFINNLTNNSQLVITTGRGIVSGLTPKARFINLSPVITSFIEINNKYLINYVLNSTRKIQ